MKKNRSNRFFLFLLVSILLLMQQTAYAYFFFTIHYSDGTKSEPFYKTDVDSICYSKIDLFGEEKNDYIIQEIWMGDSVCRIPLSLIDSISYTKVDDAVTARSVQGVLKQMDRLSSAGETIGSDASLETLASLDGVEDVYASGSNVFVKIKNWGSVTYYKAPHYDITTDTEPQATRSNAARLLSSSLSDHEHYNYRNACILNQHYRDNYFSSSKRIAADLKSSFEDVGIGCDIINNPSTDFFSDDNLGIGGKMREDKIYDYDIVFISTHGCYDERHHLHWILTSDELFNSVVGNTSSDDYTEILVRLIKSLSPRKIGIGYVKELRDRPRNVCYVSISQEYIRSSSRSFKCDGNAIVFNTACQSMKGDTGLGDAFISKGAGCYLGYNDTNSIGDGAGNEYFNMLLNGKSVVDAYQNLPNRFLTENLYENRKGEFFGSTTAGMDVVNEYHPILRMLSSGKNLCVVAPVLLPVTELYDGDYSVKISAQLRMQNPYGARAQGNSYYFLVSKNSDMSNAEKHEVYKYDENEFSFNDKTHTLTISHTFKEKDLKPLTTYFYCAVLEDKHGECRSDVEKFEIKGNGEVITLEASYAKADIAQLYGQFNFSVPIGDAGFYIGMSRDLSEYVNISVSQAAGMTNGSFYNYVIGLHPSRTYYYKAYVTVDGKTYFGETLPLNTSWVIDGEITDYKTKSADYLIEDGEEFVEFVENMHYTAPLMSTKNTTAWGVYIENFNNTGETYLFKSSTIGLNEDTQDIDIKVIKSWFDTKNVSTYQATKKVKMGIYKIVQYEEGQDIFYSTPQETILIYEQKPSLSFKTANLGSTSSDTDDYGTEYWKTGLNGKYEINGSFWLDKIDLVIIRGEAIDDVGTWKIEGDGTHDYEITYSYSKEHTSIDLAFRFDMILTNGSRVPSTNAVKVTGTNKVNGISIINTTRGVDFSSKHTSSVFARILRLSSVSKRTIKQSDSCYEKSNGGHVGFDSMRSRAQSPSGNLNTIKTLKQGITRHD